MKIILISGWASLAEFMEPLAKFFQNDFSVECLDLATLASIGNKFPAGSDVSPYAAGLLFVMENAQEPCVVGGWSMGGLVAQEAYAKNPSNFAGLMFFGTTPKFCVGDSFLYGTLASAVDAMSAMLEKAPDQVLTAFYAESTGFSTDSKRCDEYIKMAESIGIEELKRGLRYLIETDCREAAESIDCPSIVFHGSRDLVIPLKAGKELAKLSNSEFVTIKGGSHDLVLSATEQIGLKAAAFLQENF